MIPSNNFSTTTTSLAPTKPPRFVNSKTKSTSGQLPFPPVVDAMNIPGASPATTKTTSQQQQFKRVYRILAYGASLTAGTTSGFNQPLYPYSVYLEDALQQRLQQKQRLDNNDSNNDDDDYGIMIYIRHRGNPGMTVQEMVNNLDGGRRGLRNAIQGVTNPTLSMVIILAGTNDLGTTLMSALASSSSTNNKNDNAIEIGAKQIYDNIITLHEMCYTNDIPYTIAIGIPPSGYQSRNSDAKQFATLINTKLEVYANQSEIVPKSATDSQLMNKSDEQQTQQQQQVPVRRMTFVPFPFGYHNNDNIDVQQYWDKDTLHLSQLGYEKLGISLVPYIEQILNI
jgi:lysophospholipase L1-like esterase